MKKQKSNQQVILNVIHNDLQRIERKCNLIFREALSLSESVGKLPDSLGCLITSLEISARQLRNQCREERKHIEKSYLRKGGKYGF